MRSVAVRLLRHSVRYSTGEDERSPTTPAAARQCDESAQPIRLTAARSYRQTRLDVPDSTPTDHPTARIIDTCPPQRFTYCVAHVWSWFRRRRLVRCWHHHWSGGSPAATAHTDEVEAQPHGLCTLPRSQPPLAHSPSHCTGTGTDYQTPRAHMCEWSVNAELFVSQHRVRCGSMKRHGCNAAGTVQTVHTTSARASASVPASHSTARRSVCPALPPYSSSLICVIFPIHIVFPSSRIVNLPSAGCSLNASMATLCCRRKRTVAKSLDLRKRGFLSLFSPVFLSMPARCSLAYTRSSVRARAA